MIARSDAERRIRDAMNAAHVSGLRGLNPPSYLVAAHLVDEIYGVDGADAINPRYGTKQEHEAD